MVVVYKPKFSVIVLPTCLSLDFSFYIFTSR